MPFRQVTGHRPLLELLARALSRGSLPSTLIFAGPEGVGKRLTATALAQALNCERPVSFGAHDGKIGGQLSSHDSGVGGQPSSHDGKIGGQPSSHDSEVGGRPTSLGNDACGVCGPCTRIARGVHADVLVVEPGDSGSIKIDQVRDAIDRSAYRPFEGRRRVVIVDVADALVGEAQNALLKTLEEPPPSSVFVLVTSRPDLLLPTVRSRGHRLRFGALSESDVAAVLTKDHGFSVADARAAAATSDGSVGRALEENTEEAIEARDTAARVLHTVAGTTNPQRRLEGGRALAGSGDREDVWRRLLALSSLLRDMSVLASHADEHVLANADLAPQLKPLLRAFDAGRAVRAFSAVDRALAAIDRNASPKIVADWLALQL
jgi:DNA polymerase-3 subunit delta'